MSKKEDDKLNLHKEIHHKILHAKTKARITDKDVYTLSKDFFMQLLDLDYEFSHEELIEELKKTYMEKKDLDKVIKFINKMGKMEFTSNNFSNEELKGMLDELHEILDHLVHEEEHIGWFEKLKRRLGKKEAEKIIEEPADKDYTEQLKEYLKKIKTEKDEEKLKEYYQEAISTYELLSEKAKIEYYNNLLKIYYIINKKEMQEKDKEKTAKK